MWWCWLWRVGSGFGARKWETLGRRAAAKRDASSGLDGRTPHPTPWGLPTPTLKTCKRPLGMGPEDSRQGLGYCQAQCIGRHHAEDVCPLTSLLSLHLIFHPTKWHSQLQERAISREYCLN